MQLLHIHPCSRQGWAAPRSCTDTIRAIFISSSLHHKICHQTYDSVIKTFDFVLKLSISLLHFEFKALINMSTFGGPGGGQKITKPSPWVAMNNLHNIPFSLLLMDKTPELERNILILTIFTVLNAALSRLIMMVCFPISKPVCHQIANCPFQENVRTSWYRTSSVSDPTAVQTTQNVAIFRNHTSHVEWTGT